MGARLLLSVLLLTGALPGCAYLQSVGKDFGESFHLGLGISLQPAVKVSARVSVFMLNLGWMRDSWYVGNDQAYAFWWRERGYSVPLYTGFVDRWQGDGPTPAQDEQPDGYLVQDVYFIIVVPVEDRRLAQLSSSMQMVVMASDIEVGVHALFVGASFGLNITQLLDFFTGLLGYDLLLDDPAYSAGNDDD